MKKILVTGAAGFIGYHLVDKLCKLGFYVIGIDNINDYYSVSLKEARLNQFSHFSKENKFNFVKLDIRDKKELSDFFSKNKFELIVHLAAQAGVRYSIENPYAYIDSNILGFTNLLENSVSYNINNFIYASSSSVYGANTSYPFIEDDKTEHPLSMYGVTKKTNELIAHVYSNLYNINTIGLRFFTVYGPWGRPDMALFKFTKNILNEEKINVFNYGKHIRSFTYISDIIESMSLIINKQLNSNSNGDYKIFNIGGEKPIKLMNYINIIENYLNKKAKINYLDKQLGDVEVTESDSTALSEFILYKPNTPVEEGIKNFIDWYRNFYNL